MQKRTKGEYYCVGCFQIYLYDVSGRDIRTLKSEKLKPRDYHLNWDRKDDNGVYFYLLKAEDYKKTILLR